MRRRDFIVVLGGAAATWPLAARAQQPERASRIGVLLNYAESDQEARSWLDVFRAQLERLGWRRGDNIHIEERWAAGDLERLNRYAADLADMRPDLIFSEGTPVVAALQKVTRSIPVVFVGASNPVGWGFVDSLAKPGRNMTGFVTFEPGIGGKWLETLKEVAPGLSRVALLYNPETHSGQFFAAIETMAPSLAVTLVRVPFRNAAEIERGLDVFAREPSGGLLVLADASTNVHRGLIVRLATEHRLPAVYPYRFFTTLGGLVSYGPDRKDQYKRAADYVDRILKGASPGELPVQSPVKFELTVNLKAARALGLTVPDWLLARADEVIE